MAGFMKKSLTFETRKWRRQFVFFWRCRGATVVAMSETANCHLLFLKILFGFCKRESSSLFFVDFIVVVEEIYTSDLWSVTFAKSERTIFAFFSKLTVSVFLALWFVNFFLTYFKANTSYGLFSLLLMVFSPFGLVWTRCLSLNFRFRLLLWYKEPDHRILFP